MIALAGTALLVGCGSSGNSNVASAPPGTAAAVVATAAPTVAANTPTATLPPYDPKIDPAKFTDQITNPYFPLARGTVIQYEGVVNGAPTNTELVVTGESKTIMGVKCVVVRDTVTSKAALVEKTTDWYAQDTDGNVWYFGEDTKEYTNGAVSSTAGTWEAGVDGAKPGIVMEASPKVGDEYRQESRPGVAEDMAKVLQVDAKLTVPAGAYTKVIVTKDTDPLNVKKLENKYYAAGVGMILTKGTINGHYHDSKLTAVLKPK
jgi:hypothetical protein